MNHNGKFKFYALWLCLFCAIVFVLQFIPGFTEYFLLNVSSWREPWRFLTAIFLHGDIGHLLYNLFALALFGSIIERFIGGRRFLIVFFISGIIANLVSVNFYDSSLGASGAIFGVIGALVIVRPMLTVWAFGLPMPMFLAGALWAIGDVIGAVGFFVGNPLNNTGNLAHLFGMLVGFIFGFFYRNKIDVEKKSHFEFDESSMRNWEDVYLR